MSNTMHGGTPMKGQGRLTPLSNRMNTADNRSQKGSQFGSKLKSKRQTLNDSSIQRSDAGSIPGTHERNAALNLILNKSKQFSAHDQSITAGSIDSCS